MTQQAEIQTTRAIGRIRQILEEVRDCGNDMDLTKTAVEIYSIPFDDKRPCPHNYNDSFDIFCSCEDCTQSYCVLFLKESGQLAHAVAEAFESLNH